MSEFLERAVLRSNSDDFENVDQTILRDVAEQAQALGLTVTRAEVVDALARLVDLGQAKAFELSGRADPVELPGMPPLDTAEVDFKTYFYITQAGMDRHLADDEEMTRNRAN